MRSTVRISLAMRVSCGMLLAAQGAYAQTWVAGPNLPNGPRTYPAVAAIGNHVYVATGWRGNPPGPLNVLEMYDASTGQWTTGLPAVPTPRNTAAAGSLDGKLYVVGGGDGSGSVDTVEIFDPTAAPGQEWSIGPSMPTARNAPAAAVIDGKLDDALWQQGRMRLAQKVGFNCRSILRLIDFPHAAFQRDQLDT